MAAHMTSPIILLFLFIIINGVKSEDQDVDASKILTKASKISELYIGDLLRTNGKKDLDSASTHHYQASSTPNYINADKLLGNVNNPRQLRNPAQTRSEYLPPLAEDFQINKEVKRSEQVPVNMFETFLEKQGGILERNVLVSEQNPPPSRRSYSNDYPHNEKANCNKNLHQASTNKRPEYSHSRRRHPQQSPQSEYDSPPSHHPYNTNEGDSRPYYSSHSDSGPAYTSSKSKAIDSDSASKSLSSYTKSKSFSKSSTSTPNRSRQKAIILGPPGQQNYETSYNPNKSEEDSSAYSGSYAPNSYESDAPGQRETYHPSGHPDRSYRDYSPPDHTRPAGAKHRSLPKAGKTYSPQPAPYATLEHSSGNQQSHCRGPHCSNSYSPSREPQPEYSRHQQPERYEAPSRPKPHKQSRHRETPGYEAQPQYTLENGRPSQNYGPYPPERNYGGHPSNYQRDAQRIKHTSEGKHRQQNYDSHGSRPPAYPDQSREGSNYEPRSLKISRPLETYDTQIRPSREVKPQKEMGYQKNARSPTSGREIPSVEESRQEGKLPVGSSTSKSVSFSESRSYHLDHDDVSQPALPHGQQQQMTDQNSREVQSRNPGHVMAYKPYNSEYPASYANEQRQHPLHGNIEQRNQPLRRPQHSNSRYPEQRASPQARGDGSAGHHVNTKSTHEYKSDITGYKDEYASHEPLELDDEFFRKYGISKKAKIIVATAKQPNVFEADGSKLKEGESNAGLHPEEPYSPESYGQGPESYGPEPYQHGPYEHNPETSFEHNPETPYGPKPETPYGNNPESSYEHNPGISYGYKPDTPFGHNSQEGGESMDEFPSLYRQMELAKPIKIPGSFDALVNANPSFLRNVGSFELSNPAESSGRVSVSNDDKQSKSFAVSKGAGELLQKHGDGVSRIIFNKGSLNDSETYDESKKVEEFQAQGSQPEETKAQIDKSPKTNDTPEKTAT